MALTSRINLDISRRLETDVEFRNRFFRGQAQDEIATNIRGLREKRHMRQSDLAQKTGMKQSAVSRIEQADYSGWSFRVLFRVAEALEARLRITFEPAEDVIAYYREKELLAEHPKEFSTRFYDANAIESEVSTETTDEVSAASSLSVSRAMKA